MVSERISIQYAKEQDINFSIEKERLLTRVLDRAGVRDLNPTFNLIPSEVITQFGTYPNIDGGQLYPFIFELRREVERISGIQEFHTESLQYTHYMHPITEDGLVSQIAKTQLFRRLFGIYQLGPNRNYPLLNRQNRGEHSVFVAVSCATTLQSLYTQDPKRLAEKFREDFSKERLAIPDDGNGLISTGVDLTVATALLHDLATPAGGDTFKYTAGLDEKKN